eukprot:1581764-Rhodomonas_salina.2
MSPPPSCREGEKEEKRGVRGRDEGRDEGNEGGRGGWEDGRRWRYTCTQSFDTMMCRSGQVWLERRRGERALELPC